ncbi:MAG: peptidylprolyl isomerase [Telmatospirillum sp.]|nr:peptidylprolyl isomerase [Telmatospirillum sp.]
MKPQNPAACRFALAVALLVAGAAPLAAQEQRIIAVVNTEIVSNFDVDSRIGLNFATVQGGASAETRERVRPQILRQLIDERIQVQEAKRLGVSISKREIDAQVARLERANGLPQGAVDQILRRAGSSRSALERQIEASIAWGRIVSGRLRPQIEVSQEEIQETLARYSEGEPVTEYLLAEIFLSIDNPDQEAEVERNAEELIARLKGGLPFPVAAQQFSQAASAIEGGDIGWVQKGQFEDPIEQVLAGLDVNEITLPIKTPSGLYIYAMREKRVLAPASPDDALIEIAQMVFPLPPGATQSDRETTLALAETVRETVEGCADLERVAQELRVPAPTRLAEVRIGDLAADARARIRPLKVGEMTEPAPAPGGVGMTMLCVRQEPKSNLPSAADIEENLIRQRIDNAARRYLRDLRRVAVIDIRA